MCTSSNALDSNVLAVGLPSTHYISPDIAHAHLLQFLLLLGPLGCRLGDDFPQPPLLRPLVLDELLGGVQLLPAGRELRTEALLLPLHVHQVHVAPHQGSLLQGGGREGGREGSEREVLQVTVHNLYSSISTTQLSSQNYHRGFFYATKAMVERLGMHA